MGRFRVSLCRVIKDLVVAEVEVEAGDAEAAEAAALEIAANADGFGDDDPEWLSEKIIDDGGEPEIVRVVAVEDGR